MRHIADGKRLSAWLLGPITQSPLPDLDRQILKPPRPEWAAYQLTKVRLVAAATYLRGATVSVDRQGDLFARGLSPAAPPVRQASVRRLGSVLAKACLADSAQCLAERQRNSHGRTASAEE